MIRKLLEERKLPALKSRDEMLDLLLTQEYGILPPKPDKTEWKVEKNALPGGHCAEFCAGKATISRVTAEMTIGGRHFSFPFYAAIPNPRNQVGGEGQSEAKYPFFVSINFHDAVPDLWMPTEELIDNGFAVLSFCYTSVTSDNNDFTNGLAGVLYEDGRRGPTDAGKIAMWAWAAQRVLDYALTLDVLDGTRSAVCGIPDWGKQPFWQRRRTSGLPSATPTIPAAAVRLCPEGKTARPRNGSARYSPSGSVKTTAPLLPIRQSFPLTSIIWWPPLRPDLCWWAVRRTTDGQIPYRNF